MNRKEIKEWIWWYEYTNSGLRRINGGNVEVLNLRIRKDGNKAIADIKLIEEDMGDGCSKVERYNNCEYPLDKIKKIGDVLNGRN